MIIIDDDGVMHKVYTKSDVIDMLTEIQLELEENKSVINHDKTCFETHAFDSGFSAGMLSAYSIVGDRIEKLNAT